MKHQKAIPFFRHCGAATSGCDLRVEVYDFANAICAWGIMGDADPQDPAGPLRVEREMAIAADYDRKSEEPRATRTRAVLLDLADLCITDEPPEAELYGDWLALSRLAVAAAGELEPSP